VNDCTPQWAAAICDVLIELLIEWAPGSRGQRVAALGLSLSRVGVGRRGPLTVSRSGGSRHLCGSLRRALGGWLQDAFGEDAEEHAVGGP
jgi:hypothetical protein